MIRTEELIKKYKQFFSDNSPGQILVNICPYTFQLDYSDWGFDKSRERLDYWDFDKQAREFALEAIGKHRAFMEYTKGLESDYFPAVGVHLGYGVHSAYLTGADVVMGIDTSWTLPFLTDWSMLERLKPDRDNYWYRKIMEICGYLNEYNDGDYAVSTFTNAGPGDMANAIRGNDLFYDLTDEPENVHKLMDVCVDAVIWLETEMRKIAGFINGGTVTANCWFPCEAPYISEDFNDLCSDAMYNAFGRIYTQKILDRFGGAYIHHHAKGFHIHKSIASLRGLKLLEISLDPNCDRPIDRIEELFEMHGDVPLMVRCHARDLPTHIERFKKGRLVIMLNIDDLDEGVEAMRLVRKHSII